MTTFKDTAHPRPLKPWFSISAGAIAACSAVLFSNMPEVIKTRIQLDGEGGFGKRQYKGVADAFKQIWRNEGIRGLQAGLGAAMLYQAVMNGCRLGLYDPFQRIYHRVFSSDATTLHSKVICGAFSGAVGATLGSPLYLVKNRLQAESKYFKARETHEYKGIFDGLIKLVQKEGYRGLFRGIDGAIPRVMVGSSTQLASFDYCRVWLAKNGVANGTTQALISSLVSSLITVTVMNPLDVVSTRLYQSSGHVTHYSGPLDCAIKLGKSEGAAAFFKGWTPQYIRLGPHTIITFLLLEHVKPYMQSIDAFVIDNP